MKKKAPIPLSSILTQKNNAARQFAVCLKATAKAYKQMMSRDEHVALVDDYGLSWDETLEYFSHQTPHEIVDAYLVRRLQGVGARIDLDDHRSLTDIPRPRSMEMRIRRDNKLMLDYAEDLIPAR